MRTRRDLNYLKNYLEASDYNFVINEKKVDDLMNDSISSGDVKSALISRNEDIIINIEKLIHILNCDSVERKELVSDYLKTKYDRFEVLKQTYNHAITKKYSDIIHDKTCSKLLFNWCTGEEIGADNSLNLLRLKDSNIDLLQKTLNNLKIEKSGEVKKDDKFLRFIEVRKWVRGLKSGKESVTINSAIIKDFINYFNDRYVRLYNPDKIDGVVTDLNVIFDVQKSTKSNKKSYLIRDEWTFNNIRGISFTESRLNLNQIFAAQNISN